MTENKQLKARVRARMARTGESYTSAHRHVVAARSDRTADSLADVPGAVPGYPEFGGHIHRLSALAARMLTQAGCATDEVLACGLGGGIGFMYAVFEYKQLDHPLLTVVAQHHPAPWLQTAAGHLGLDVTTQHSSSGRAALGKLDQALAEGSPAQLVVARGHLPWHPVADAMEAADPYPVVVAGVDDHSFLVDDLPDGPQRIDRETMAQAWTAHRKGRHELVTVHPTTGEVDVAAGVRSALRMTADHLDGPVLGNAFDVNFGLSGMHKLAAELRDTRTRSGWVRRFGDPAGFGYATARLAECLTTAYTSEGATRPLYASFLARAADRVSRGDLAEAAETVAAAGAQWRALAELCREVSGPGRAGEPEAVFAAMADLVESAADREQQAVALIRRSLGS